MHQRTPMHGHCDDRHLQFSVCYHGVTTRIYAAFLHGRTCANACLALVFVIPLILHAMPGSISHGLHLLRKHDTEPTVQAGHARPEVAALHVLPCVTLVQHCYQGSASYVVPNPSVEMNGAMKYRCTCTAAYSQARLPPSTANEMVFLVC
jgi:hypothetical protein